MHMILTFQIWHDLEPYSYILSTSEKTCQAEQAWYNCNLKGLESKSFATFNYVYLE